jgi:hypothetical protein
MIVYFPNYFVVIVKVGTKDKRKHVVQFTYLWNVEGGGGVTMIKQYHIEKKHLNGRG